jgi:hypothetical protein
MNRHFLKAGVTAVAVAFTGCTADSGTVSLTARPTTSTQALITGTTTEGTSLTRVRLLINEAELRGGGHHGMMGGPRGAPPASAQGTGQSFCMHKGKHVEQGPFIVTVDAAAIAAGTVTDPVLLADVPAGTYQGAELELAPVGSEDVSAQGRGGMMHGAPPPSATTPVASLGAEFDDFKSTGATIIIEGTFAGAAYTYNAAFATEQESVDPITVVAGTPVSLGLVIDASTWFVDAAGGALDPSVAANHDAIAANIKKSLTIENDPPRGR